LWIFLIFWPFISSFEINDVLKPDLVSVVTAHMVYFCDFACSEKFQENAMELGLGCGKFYAGVNGLKIIYIVYHYGKVALW